MARIPDADIERLKREVSLERLAEAAGITLKRHGQDLIGLCPFHDDHEPSLVITPSKNLWHCLGACQSGGSVIDWVMQMEGVSFRHAVALLREGVPTLGGNTAPVKQGTVRKLAAPVSLDADDQALLNQVVDYYHETLKQNPDALAYLDKRGINHPEAIDHFKLGVANRTLGLRLPEKNRVAGAELRSRLQRLGLYRDSGHEHFNGSLVIPVLDDNGNVSEVYGRKIIDRLRKGTPKHLYLPGPHKGIFNLDALKASKEIILCESLIDALTFWCAGYRHVTASYGIEGFTATHLQAFKENKTERVLIAYDRDAAGDKAATLLAEQLIKAGLDCYRLPFPKGMDANSYACQVQPASKSLGVVIRSAEWLGKGKPATPLTTTATGIETNPTPATKSKNESITPLAADLEDLATSLASHDTPLPATVIPDAPRAEVNAAVSDEEVVMCFGDRRYRIRGLNKNLSVNSLKVNVLVSREAAIHVDTFDLYAHKARTGFIKQATVELGVNDEVIKKDLGQVLLALEVLQERHLKQAITPTDMTVTMSEHEKNEALTLLKDKHLLQRLLDDFATCGVVGEQTNKLVGYLAAVSRKLDEPLAIIIQSTSAAGKSALMDAVLAMMPEEDKVQYSAMTGQSLFYMEDGNLAHKILAISEEEGAHQAAYALKLLQSEGELTIASTGKDPDSGKHVTHEYKVEGPVMIFSTTTALDIDEELMNRCLVLTVDESRDQTKAIHHRQREKRTLAGLQRKQEKKRRLSLHHNAQRLLRPLAVVNPYAHRLTFLDDRTRARRDHEKYLTLIDALTLLHQYQRPVHHTGEGTAYVEVTLDDIEAANRLAHDVLGRSLDELPPQTRRLLGLVHDMVCAHCEAHAIDPHAYHFSRKAVREATHLSDTQLKLHLHRLVDMDYLVVHKQGHRYLYELLYDGEGNEGQPFMMGLVDVATLKHDYDAKRSGLTPERSGAGRPPVGAMSGGGRTDKTGASSLNNRVDPIVDSDDHETTVIKRKPVASHRSPALVARVR